MPYAYPLFDKRVKHIFGGSEARAFLFATELAKNPKNRITFAVFDHGQKSVETFGPIRVFRLPHRFPWRWHERKYTEFFSTVRTIKDFKWPGLKQFVSLAPMVFALLGIKIYRDWIVGREDRSFEILFKKIDADIFATFGASDYAFEVLNAAKKIGRKTAMFTGSDNDFLERYYPGSQETNQYGSRGDRCFSSVVNADFVIVQTESQKLLLQSRYRRNGTVVKNATNIDYRRGVPFSERRHALWIGKSDAIKRPDRLLELAALCGQIKFIMVMNMSDRAIHNKILSSLPSNVSVIDHVPFSEINSLFEKAFVFINTSEFEGFPNTFLQAGMAGCPILSSIVNPDQFISRYSCGLVSEAPEAGAKFIQEISTNESKWKTFSSHVQDYVVQFHDVQKNAVLLKQAFENPISR